MPQTFFESTTKKPGKRSLFLSWTISFMVMALTGCTKESMQADMRPAFADLSMTGNPPPDLAAPDLFTADLRSGPDLQAAPDTLYVGDDVDDTVKQYDALTGAYGGTLVTTGSGGLHGPRALLVAAGGAELWVANQNTNLPKNGEILRYNLSSGAFLSALVASSATGSPYAPRGMIMSGSGELIVADLGELAPPPPGRLPRYSGSTGALLANLDTTGFLPPFLPRGVVIGPDGLLYVSAIDAMGQNGYVLRFDLTTKKYQDTFITAIASTSYANGLHKPEGLVFSPEGNLYITSFRYAPGDTSRIMVYDSHGKYIDRIDLDSAAAAPNYAQALLFGPSGRLYVGMSISGEIRSYDVSSKAYSSFVPSGGALRDPWYMTFGKTNPATLAYGL